MATTYWKPKAVAIAQVSTAQITANDTATTYKLTVNGITVSTAGNAGGVNDTASDLADAWNAATSSYFTGVTASSATDTVTLTADTAGLPFTVTSSVTGGTGTIGAVATGTSATGPYHWDNASNWSGGAVPVNSDDVIISDTDISLLYGLNQSSVALASLTINKSFTGLIGLDSRALTTAADGETTDSSVPEYRDTYLQIGTAILDIGEHQGQDNPAGSTRIMLDLGATACQINVFDTAQTSADAGRPCTRLLANNSSTDIFVRKAIGGIGFAVDEPDETSTIGDVTITDRSSSTRFQTTAGVTFTNWTQSGGQNVMNGAATVTALDVTGGTLRTEGDYTITTINLDGGTINCNHIKTAGNAITTLNLSGGVIDGNGNGEARTWATVNMTLPGGAIRADGNVVTITTLNEPADRYSLTLTTQS